MVVGGLILHSLAPPPSLGPTAASRRAGHDATDACALSVRLWSYQKPHTPWMYDIGMNLSFSKQLQLAIDLGTDLSGGYVIVLGPTCCF